MAGAELRPVRAGDVAEVTRLIREVLAEFGLEFGIGSPTDEEVLGLPSSYESAGGRFWVAEKGASLIGTCGVYPLDATTFELRKMYVRPDARGEGLGRAFFSELLPFVRAKGARTLVLDTVHTMEAAIRFYERNGFVRDDQQVRGARCNRGYRLDLATAR